MLAIALPAVAKLVPDGVRRIRYDRGWIHTFGDGIVVEPQPRLRSYDIGDSRNRFLWGLLYEPKPGDTIVDVGAGLGAETIYFSQCVGPTGRVIAIEAHPEICGYLERSIALNEFSQTKVLNVAVSNHRGTVYIEDSMENLLGNTLTTEGQGVLVEATTLDALATGEGIDRIDFLKMNIEGAERLAIEGMHDTLAITAVLCISCHDFKHKRTGNEFFKTKDIVQDRLKDNGFVIVPRESGQPEIADQVNAFNPALVGHDLSPQVSIRRTVQ